VIYPAKMASIDHHSLDYRKDRPLRLAVAVKAAFPDGSMTASGLRREARRGHLVIERIAGKDYTTLNAIEEMRALAYGVGIKRSKVRPRHWKSI